MILRLCGLTERGKGDGGGFITIGVPYYGWGVQVGRTDKPDRKDGNVTSDVVSGRGKDRRVTGNTLQAGSS